MITPPFAIAVPVGHWHPLLPHALNSLKLQGDLAEIWLFDASGDERVRKACDQSGIDFHYVHRGSDDGQAAVIAEVWSHTERPYLGWLNADDILIEGSLQRVLSEFRSDSRLAVIHGDALIINDAKELIGLHGQTTAVSSYLLQSNIIAQPSAFVRRSDVEAVGGLNPLLQYTMDWDLWVRLYVNGSKFRYLPEPLSLVYWGGATKTASLSWRRLIELFRLRARYTNSVQAMKTVMAMYRHQVRVNAGLQSQLINHSKRVERPGLRMCAVGEDLPCSIRRNILMPIINTTCSRASMFEIILKGPEAGNVRVEVDRVDCSRIMIDDQLIIRFKANVPVPLGCHVPVKLVLEKGVAVFQLARWLKDQPLDLLVE